ncbi:prolyl endopeptidase-like protein [Neocallimastix lanati (nom. inval.)]|jgi:prolyl oligopeptidase|uniref:Prolyl endopeptidase n=1 Tax=Neocallimastix californiae TaxID=1754190 RepID=A0A1Y2EIP9_9FUNG|nr:prolyl endopeptidase-like protein [Neocallimastix sp. JGI-2020a]ORY70675.1 prolyl endopeptidase-like protein [Neocallimastix californiae]|eukprot:ORY70675.1 prolyl endopeptidase-like protein [Neocallimastix californiae]
MEYPQVRRDETVVENHFGIEIKDPYRWLEDPDSEETKKFVEEQNKITFKYVNEYEYREKLMNKLLDKYNYERFGCMFKRGKGEDAYYYYFHNTGLQSQSVLYRQKTLDSEPEIFFDPNTLSDDGTVALSHISFSDSGKYFSYSLSKSGSDWVQIYIKKIENGKLIDVDKPLEWVKFSGITWTKDEKGIFYQRYPKPNIGQDKSAGTETDQNANAMMYYHKLGTEQDQDILFYSEPENPQNMFGIDITDDGRYLLLIIEESCDPKNKVYIMKINGEINDKPEFIKLVDEFDAEYSFIHNVGSTFFFKTSKDAPQYKVVKININDASSKFVDVIPQSKQVIDYLLFCNNNSFVINYLYDAKHSLKVYDISGKYKFDIKLQEGSIISGLRGRETDYELFYSVTSFINPGTVYKCDLRNNSCIELKRNVVKDYDPNNYVVKQKFYPSKDGTNIPMFIVHKKGLELNGNNPTLLYGYGGFNISILPYFSPVWITWITHFNGIYVVANIRGGGEYGETWYNAGKLDNKQNVFDDFQWAAKYLINLKYTCPEKLCINGGSNGGLLVGACINQAPELFGCAVADVGVMDMLRFHKFTIGHAWVSDYGDPDKEHDFKTVLKYSPLHNVRENTEYPAVLLTTSDHDDRVVPLHSLKLISQLQYVAGKYSKKPLIIRIDTKAGHGGGKPVQKRIEEATDKISFINKSINAEWCD